MFTGIVQGVGTVVDIIEKKNFRTHILELDNSLIDHLQIGASIAHNGCCLTVTEINGKQISFDLMQETLKVTNLGDLKLDRQLILNGPPGLVMRLAVIKCPGIFYLQLKSVK